MKLQILGQNQGRRGKKKERKKESGKDKVDDDQWRYSPDRALASLTGFMIVTYSRQTDSAVRYI
jgi:hypothetical protein